MATEPELLDALAEAVASPLYLRGARIAAAQRACDEAGISVEHQRQAAARGRRIREGHQDRELEQLARTQRAGTLG